MQGKLRDLSLSVRIHQRYRIIEEVRKGRAVVEAAERVGCHFTVAYDPSSTLSKMMFFPYNELERADDALALHFCLPGRHPSAAGRHSRAVGGTATPAAFSTA